MKLSKSLLIIATLVISSYASFRSSEALAQWQPARSSANDARNSGIIKVSDSTSTKEVSLVQRELSRQGFDIGSVDGIIGNKTKKAIMVFKRSKDMRPFNAEITPDLIARLKSAPTLSQDKASSQMLEKTIDSLAASRSYLLLNPELRASAVLAVERFKTLCNENGYEPACLGIEPTDRYIRSKIDHAIKLSKKCSSDDAEACYYLHMTYITASSDGSLGGLGWKAGFRDLMLSDEQKGSYYKEALRIARENCEAGTSQYNLESCHVAEVYEISVLRITDPDGAEEKLRKRREEELFAQRYSIAVIDYMLSDCSNLGALAKSVSSDSELNPIDALVNNFRKVEDSCIVENFGSKFILRINGASHNQCVNSDRDTERCNIGVSIHCQIESDFGEADAMRLISDLLCKPMNAVIHPGTAVFVSTGRTVAVKDLKLH